jgi:hypothetical protein
MCEHRLRAGELLELAARGGDTRAVARDEAREQIADDVAVAICEAAVDLVGVARERSGDAADRGVCRVVDRTSAALRPQLRRGE